MCWFVIHDYDLIYAKKIRKYEELVVNMNMTWCLYEEQLEDAMNMLWTFEISMFDPFWCLVRQENMLVEYYWIVHGCMILQFYWLVHITGSRRIQVHVTVVASRNPWLRLETRTWSFEISRLRLANSTLETKHDEPKPGLRVGIPRLRLETVHSRVETALVSTGLPKCYWAMTCWAICWLNYMCICYCLWKC